MQAPSLITARDFCSNHQIDLSFIRSLSQYGLLEVNVRQEQILIPDDQLSSLEKIVRLHYDLDINLEGIEAILHLLNRVEGLQQEMLTLKNKLELYEDRDE